MDPWPATNRYGHCDENERRGHRPREPRSASAWTPSSATPAASYCRSTTASPRIPRCATSSCGTSRAAVTQPTATRVRRGASAWRWRPRDPARRTSSPRSTNAMMDSVPDAVHHRQRRPQPARQGRLPGGRHHRHHDADREAQLPRDARRGHRVRICRGGLHRDDRPPRPGAHRHPEGRLHRGGGVQSGPSRSRSAATGPRQPATPRTSSAPPSFIDDGRAADHHRGPRRHPRPSAAEELRHFAEKTGIPVLNTLLGLGGIRRDHALSYGMMGMHGSYEANHAASSADVDHRHRQCAWTTARSAASPTSTRRRRSSTSTSTPPSTARTSSRPRRSSAT